MKPRINVMSKPVHYTAFRTDNEPGKLPGIRAHAKESGSDLLAYTPGDWILEAEDGSRFAVSPQVFDRSYVEVKERPRVSAESKDEGEDKPRGRGKKGS